MSNVRMVLPSFRSAATSLAVAVIVASIVNVAFSRFVEVSLALNGAAVLLGGLWMPLTWLLVELSPQGVIFSALAIWSVGGALESQWGRAGMWRYALGVTFASGLLTVALSLASREVALHVFGGGTVMATALWVTYGLRIGNRPANFFGLPMSGYALAGLGGGMTLLSAIFYGPAIVAPSLIALVLVLLMWKFGTPSDLLTRFGSWRLSRRLKRRSRHLSSISSGSGDARGSDKFLQ
jgi:Eukaryotic integral membrane protein (DUF1751)